MQPMPRVIMVVSNTGYHWEEVFGAYRVFKNAGWQIDCYTVDGRPPRPDPVSLKRTGPLAFFGFGISSAIAPETTLGQELQKKLDHARSLATLDAANFAALYLPGGHGCLFDLNGNSHLHAVIAKAYQNNCILSGVCHATATFAFAQINGNSIVKGKRLTGFPDLLDTVLVTAHAVSPDFLPIPMSNEQELKKAGAISTPWHKVLAHLNPRFTLTDPPFVTGVGPKAAGKVAKKVLQLYAIRTSH